MRFSRSFFKYGVFAIVLFVCSGLADVQHEETISTQSIREVLSHVKELNVDSCGHEAASHDKDNVQVVEAREGRGEQCVHDKKVGAGAFSMLNFDALETSMQKIEKHMHDLEQEVQTLKKRITWFKDVAALLQVKQLSCTEKNNEEKGNIIQETQDGRDIQAMHATLSQIQTTSQTQTTTHVSDGRA